MKQYKEKRSIAKMAKIFRVSRSGYYAWESRKLGKNALSKHALEDMALGELIEEIFKAHYSRYGSPRIWAELKDSGIKISRKRVARLMRERKLRVRRTLKWLKTTDSNHGLPVAENILDRKFYAMHPGEKWVSDITYLRTNGGWLYLTVIIDLWDRQVIGWSITTSMHTENICLALKMAVLNRQPRKDLIFHSDRGVQYCSELFRTTLLSLCPTVRQSMSRKGNCWDNAPAESFFKTLKWELPIFTGKLSRQEVKTKVFEYIEIYYNRCRRHSAIGYATPLALTNKVAA
jgi:transposase InsO family protein